MDPNMHLNTHPIEDPTFYSMQDTLHESNGSRMLMNLMASEKLTLRKKGLTDRTRKSLVAFSDGTSFSLDCHCSDMPIMNNKPSIREESIADTLVAEELMTLDCRQRDMIYHDIHGIPTPSVTESAALLQTCLAQMEHEFKGSTSATPRNELGPTKGNDESLRLRFLRVERFNVERATKRLHQYLKLNSLFGKDDLNEDPTRNSLLEVEASALHESYVGSCLPELDTAGRFVIYQTFNRSSSSMHSAMRKVFYSMMSYSEDIEVQQRGCVIVFDIPPKNSTKMAHSSAQELFEWARQWGTMLSALPLRVEAVHMCSESNASRPIMGAFKLSCDQNTRLRVREHIGSVCGLLASLTSFGIPTKALQESSILESQASISASWVSKHGLERSEGEQQAAVLLPVVVTPSVTPPSVEAPVVKPSARDILLGRGKSSYNHEGNIRLRNMVSKHADLYEVAPFSEKKKVAADIVDLLKATSTRFLKELPDGKWVEVDDETARRKVGHAFRTHRSLTAQSKVGKFMMARQKVREEISRGIITVPSF